jgi:hypothetical protein
LKAAADPDMWKKKKKKKKNAAKWLITTAVDTELLAMIVNCKTVADMWERLFTIHEQVYIIKKHFPSHSECCLFTIHEQVYYSIKKHFPSHSECCLFTIHEQVYSIKSIFLLIQNVVYLPYMSRYIASKSIFLLIQNVVDYKSIPSTLAMFSSYFDAGCDLGGECGHLQLLSIHVVEGHDTDVCLGSSPFGILDRCERDDSRRTTLELQFCVHASIQFERNAGIFISTLTN